MFQNCRFKNPTIIIFDDAQNITSSLGAFVNMANCVGVILAGFMGNGTTYLQSVNYTDSNLKGLISSLGNAAAGSKIQLNTDNYNSLSTLTVGDRTLMEIATSKG